MASYTNDGVIIGYSFISGKNAIEITNIGLIDPDGELILTIPDTLEGAPVVQIATAIPMNTAELYIGKNMRYIDIPATFNQAHNIHTIHVANLNNYYKTIDGVLFDKDELTLVYYPSGNMTESYTIPSTVETVGSYAFMNSNAQHIIISDSVKNIQSYAFNFCRHIKEIIIPDNVAFLGESNFYQCTSMTKATIGRGITEIHDYIFYDCASLKTVELSDSITNIGYAFIESPVVELIISEGSKIITDVLAIHWKGTLEKIVIPNSATEIAANAFRDQDSLIDLSIGTSVLTIGPNAFNNCNALKELVLPNNVTSIGSNAFNNCYSLTSINIPDSVTFIGNSAFFGCDNLKSVYITDIAAWCDIEFEGFEATPLLHGGNLYLNDILVETLEIPQGVTAINDNVFYNCKSLTQVSLPNSVVKIGEYAFAACGKLTHITIPEDNAITYIGNYSFMGCKSLTEFIIPDTVTNFGYSVFSNCESLATVQLPNNDTIHNIPGSTFNNCKALKSITIPNNILSIDMEAFCGCESLTTIAIPVGVEGISAAAFYGCNNLVTITLPYTVSFIGNDCFYINNYDKVTRHIYYKGTPWQKEHNLRYDVSIGTNKQIMESFVWHYSLDGRIKTSQGLKNINEVYVIVKDADTLIRKPIYDFL